MVMERPAGIRQVAARVALFRIEQSAALTTISGADGSLHCSLSPSPREEKESDTVIFMLYCYYIHPLPLSRV